MKSIDDSNMAIPKELLDAERRAKRAGRVPKAKAKPKRLGYADDLRRRLEDAFCAEMSEALAAAFIVVKKRLKAEAAKIPPEAGAKGGPGSGNFGHAGRPGEVGGSAPSGSGSADDEHRQWEQRIATEEARASIPKEGLTVYHGTDADAAKKIEKEGLKRGPKLQERPPSVYFTTNRSEAELWGWSGTREPGNLGDTFAVVEFTLPSEWKDEVIADERMRDPRTMRIERDIPPENVTRVSVHQKERGGGPYFTVVFIKTKAEKAKKPALPKPLEDMLDDDDFWQDVGADVRAAFRANATAIIREAAKYKMSLGIAVDMNTIDTWMIKFTRDYTNWWWDGLSKTTRDGLRESLLTWQETGFGKRGFEDLVKSVGDVFFDVDAAGNPIADPVRARLIATTETTNLFDEGNREAERTIGVVEQEWMTCEDEWVCTVPIFFGDELWQGCADLNGKRFPIDDGPRPARDTHPNCRCNRVGVAPNGEIMKD